MINNYLIFYQKQYEKQEKNASGGECTNPAIGLFGCFEVKRLIFLFLSRYRNTVSYRKNDYFHSRVGG